jgi:hypothetical protein
MHKLALEPKDPVNCGKMAAERALKIPISNAVFSQRWIMGRFSSFVDFLHPAVARFLRQKERPPTLLPSLQQRRKPQQIA